MRSTSARVAVAVLYDASGSRACATAHPPLPSTTASTTTTTQPLHESCASPSWSSPPAAPPPGRPNMTAHSPLTGWLTAIDVAVIAPVESDRPMLATQRPTLTSLEVAFADPVQVVSAEVVTFTVVVSDESGRADST